MACRLLIAAVSGNADTVEERFSDYGMLVIPTDLSEGAGTTLETPQCQSVSRAALGDEFKYFEKAQDSFRFTVCIVQIPVKHYARRFTVRPFIHCIAEDGEYVVYA